MLIILEEYSRNNIQVKILSCEGVEAQQAVAITFMVTNIERGSDDRSYWKFYNGIDTEGGTYEKYSWDKLGGGPYYLDLPADVPVKRMCYIKVYDKISGFSYLKFEIKDCVVTIKDLPVTWK